MLEKTISGKSDDLKATWLMVSLVERLSTSSRGEA